MARAIPFPMRFYSEVSQLVVAEWVRMVETGAPMNVDALTVAFNQILDMPTVAVKDGVGTKTDPLKIIVPMPPIPPGLSKDKAKEALSEYLRDNHEDVDGLGKALLFGCGR